MKKNLFDKRIPTFFALIILVIGLVTTAILVRNGVFIVSRASPNQEPQNIQVVNVTSTSFTVVFTTLDQEAAGISIDDAPEEIYFDDREKSGVKTFMSHFIPVTNLTPKTKYTFSVLSHGKTYLQNGNKFEVITLSATQETKTGNVISGAVLLPDGAPGSDTLILVNTQNANPSATITDDNGNFSISTDLIKSSLNTQPLTLIPGQQIDLEAYRGNLASKVSYAYQKNGTVPTISLSNNYSFVASNEAIEVGTESSNLKLPGASKLPPRVAITTPKDNETFIDQRPQFKGTAIPNSIIKITIHSAENIQIQVRADPNGNWSYRPSVLLSVGPHTITVETVDAAGILKTVTSSFTVFAAGSQIAETATPSATPSILPTVTKAPSPTATPAIIPSPSITAQITSIATPTITAVPSPTATPTATATTTPIPPTPTPTIAVVVPPKSNTPPPPSGNQTHTIFLTTMSILFIVAGSTLFFIL